MKMVLMIALVTCVLVWAPAGAQHGHDAHAIATLGASYQPQSLSEQFPIVGHMLYEEDCFYYVDVARHHTICPSLPIGVFDSGTGGLAVLEAIMTYDGFHNTKGLSMPDGIPDFEFERFIYLADQTNMPYGLYFGEGKEDLLIEHLFKNLHFLLSGKYYESESSLAAYVGNEPVKAIVIACNTATASGKRHLEAFMDYAGLALPVFGVIDAGARGVLEHFGQTDSGSVGILATLGTIATRGYEETIERLGAASGVQGEIRVYSQGGLGLAESIDEVPGYYNREAQELYDDYLGPTFSGPGPFAINRDLMEAYNFDFSGNRMLYSGDHPWTGDMLQINHPVNYLRFHLVSLLETMLSDPRATPMEVLVLGCTHYPYLLEEIQHILKELYHYRENEIYPYRAVLSRDVKLVDPAHMLARELYVFLMEESLTNIEPVGPDNRFYISVPNSLNPDIRTDAGGAFTHAYKYGRKAGEIQQYVKVVPFSQHNMQSEILERLQTKTPAVFEEMLRFAPDLHLLRQ